MPDEENSPGADNQQQDGQQADGGAPAPSPWSDTPAGDVGNSEPPVGEDGDNDGVPGEVPEVGDAPADEDDDEENTPQV